MYIYTIAYHRPSLTPQPPQPPQLPPLSPLPPRTTTTRNLLASFPHNTYLLSQLGCAAHDAGFQAEAVHAFRAARRQDAMLVDFMDIYGSALFFKVPFTRRMSTTRTASTAALPHCRELRHDDILCARLHRGRIVAVTWSCHAAYNELTPSRTSLISGHL